MKVIEAAEKPECTAQVHGKVKNDVGQEYHVSRMPYDLHCYTSVRLDEILIQDIRYVLVIPSGKNCRRKVRALGIVVRFEHLDGLLVVVLNSWYVV